MHKGLLTIGWLLRISLAPVSGVINDVYPWAMTVDSVHHGYGVYGSQTFSYPQVWGYLLSSVDLASTLLVKYSDRYQLITSLLPLQYTSFVKALAPNLSVLLLIKSLIIIADWSVLNKLFHFWNASKSAKHLVLWGWWLNPLVISTGAIQGQFDSISISFAIAAMIAWNERNTFRSGFLAGALTALGFFTKGYPLVILFVLTFTTFVTKFRQRLASPSRMTQLGGAVLGFSTIFFAFQALSFAEPAGATAWKRLEYSLQFRGINAYVFFQPLLLALRGLGNSVTSLAICLVYPGLIILFFPDQLYARVIITLQTLQRTLIRHITSLLEDTVVCAMFSVFAFLSLYPIVQPQYWTMFICFCLITPGIGHPLYGSIITRLIILASISTLVFLRFVFGSFTFALLMPLAHLQGLTAEVDALSTFQSSWGWQETWLGGHEAWLVTIGGAAWFAWFIVLIVCMTFRDDRQ